MTKMVLEDLVKVLSSDVIKYKTSIELNFCIDNDSEYEDCWMGKMADKDNSKKEIYWYGLVEDGSQEYSYDELEDIMKAKVFNDKSMYDIIEKITWCSLDGCDIDERLPDYIDNYETRL